MTSSTAAVEERAEHQACATGIGPRYSGQLPFGMAQPMKGRRRQQDGKFKLLAQDFSTQIDAGYDPQGPGE